MKKTLLATFICLGVSMILTGCDSKSSSSSHKSYPSDSVNVSKLLKEGNPTDSQADKNKQILTKMNVDELIAVNDYVISLKGQPMPDNVTLKTIVEDYNVLHPTSPVIRGKVSSFNDYYYRDLLLLGLQGKTTKKDIAPLQDCIVNQKSPTLNNMLQNQPESIYSLKIGKIYNICYPDKKVSYNDITPIEFNGKSANILLSDPDFVKTIMNVHSSQDLKMGLDKYGLSIDQASILRMSNGQGNIKENLDSYNAKYINAQSITSKVTLENAYLRDADLLKLAGVITSQQLDNIGNCSNELKDKGVYPYSSIESNMIDSVALNIPMSKIVADCKVLHDTQNSK